MLRAPCAVLRAPCSVLRAPCSVLLHAPCSVLRAPCFLFIYIIYQYPVLVLDYKKTTLHVSFSLLSRSWLYTQWFRSSVKSVRSRLKDPTI